MCATRQRKRKHTHLPKLCSFLHPQSRSDHYTWSQGLSGRCGDWSRIKLPGWGCPGWGAWEDRVVGKVARQPFRSYVSGPRSREISKHTRTRTNTRTQAFTYPHTHVHTHACTHIHTPRRCTHTHTSSPCIPARQAAQSRDTVRFVETVPPLSQDAVKGSEGRFLCKLASGHCKTQCLAAPAFPGPLPLPMQPLLGQPRLGQPLLS